VATPRVPTGFRPSIQNYGYGPTTGRFLTQVGGALPRTGRRWRRGTAVYNVTMVLTRLKLNVWTAFYFGIIDEGAVQFFLPLDTQGGDMTDHLCVMTPDSYRVEMASGQLMWNVRFDVVAEPPMVDITTDDAQNIIDLWELYGDSTERILDGFTHLSTVKLTELNAVTGDGP
jgi:hypothetical protein